MAKKIGIFVGSLRKEAYTQRIAQAVIPLFPQGFEADIVPIGDLPLYNEDLDTPDNLPDSWAEFRQRVGELDAALFITPEYNRSTTAALKNALDVASRPYVENKWSGLPAAVISSSISALGGFGANHQLRQTLCVLNLLTMAQPESYVGLVQTRFDEDGVLTDKGTQAHLQRFVDAFAQWIARLEE